MTRVRSVLAAAVTGTTVLVLGTFGVVRLARLKPLRMSGVSMEPTLHNNDRFFASTDVSELTRGDLVLYRYPQNPSKVFVNRIVGLPGDTIEIRAGQVYINQAALHEPYAVGRNEPESGPIRIPENEFYVLGDNREHANDSRAFGPIERGAIVGRYVAKYWNAGA